MFLGSHRNEGLQKYTNNSNEMNCKKYLPLLCAMSLQNVGDHRHQ